MKTKIIIGIGIVLIILSNVATWYIMEEKNLNEIGLAWDKGEDNYRGFVISNFVGAGRYCEPIQIIYNPNYIKKMPSVETIIHNDNRLIGYFLDVEAPDNSGDYQMLFMNMECKK